MKPKRLDDLTLHEISLVKKGANPHAKILLAKDAEDSMPKPEKSPLQRFVSALKDAFSTVAKDDEQKEQLDEILKEAEGALAAPVVDATADTSDLDEGDADGADGDAEDAEVEVTDEEIEVFRRALGKGDDEDEEWDDDEGDEGEGDEADDEGEEVEKEAPLSTEAVVELQKGCGECKDGAPCKKHKAMAKQAKEAEVAESLEILKESLLSIVRDESVPDPDALIAASVQEFQSALRNGAVSTAKEDASMAAATEKTEKVEKTADEILKELPEPVRKMVEKAQADADAAKASAAETAAKLQAKEQAERESEAASAVQKMLGNVAGDHRAIGKVLCKLEKEDRELLEGVFKSAGELSKQSSLFKTEGQDGRPTIEKEAQTAEAKLEVIAKELEQSRGLKPAEAYRTAMKEHPDLVKQANPDNGRPE